MPEGVEHTIEDRDVFSPGNEVGTQRTIEIRPGTDVDEFKRAAGIDDLAQTTEVGFSGEMCAIAKASASLLLMSIEGMTAAAVAVIHDTQVLQNLDAPIRSNRINCALLPAAALRGAIRSCDGRGKTP